MKKYLGFAAISLLLLPLIASCSNEEYEYLRVYNNADYIYEGDNTYGEDDETLTPEKKEFLQKSLMEQFEIYMKEEYGRNVKVIYDTYDVNETMLSQVKTNKVQYDLICSSDYALQKLISEGLVVPFEDENGNSTTKVYEQYVSPFLTGKLDSIPVRMKNIKDGKIEYDEPIYPLNRYAKGYMWGTLGLIIDPEFVDVKDFEYDYSSLWSEKYKGKIAIKDSIRDTMAVGVAEAFKNDDVVTGEPGFDTLFKNLENERNEILNSTVIVDKEKEIHKLEQVYNKKITEMFNKCDKDTLDKVLKKLQELKNNIYGFEVDWGKEEIQKGANISICLAWSGDATYAMDNALEYHDGRILKYVVPKLVGNIWFDGWVIPKGNATGKELQDKIELASLFVDYLSTPSVTQQNMEWIGYTPFMGGETIFEYVKDSYGDEPSEGEKYFTKDLSYFFKTNEKDNADYKINILEEKRYTQIDTQYPDSDALNGLCVMNDFGESTKSVNKMWTELRNTMLPLYVYIIILVAAVAIIVFSITRVCLKKKAKKLRTDRRKSRTVSSKK